MILQKNVNSSTSPLNLSRGFICIASLNRADELRKFLTSLKAFNKEPVLTLWADNRVHAHLLKTKIAQLSPFLSTVQIDTDILVNGNLKYLFEVAERKKIGAFIPTMLPDDIRRLNSGVLCYNTRQFLPLSMAWEKEFLECTKRKHNSMDQGFIGKLLVPERAAGNIEILPEIYNFCLKEYKDGTSGLDEVKDFHKIKIFHFFTSHYYAPFGLPDSDIADCYSYQKFNKL